MLHFNQSFRLTGHHPHSERPPMRAPSRRAAALVVCALSLACAESAHAQLLDGIPGRKQPDDRVRPDERVPTAVEKLHQNLSNRTSQTGLPPDTLRQLVWFVALCLCGTIHLVLDGATRRPGRGRARHPVEPHGSGCPWVDEQERRNAAAGDDRPTRPMRAFVQAPPASAPPGERFYTLEVSYQGQAIGRLRLDAVSGACDADPGVPDVVVSDIVMTYYRENVVFGRSGDGYHWREVRETEGVTKPKPECNNPSIARPADSPEREPVVHQEPEPPMSHESELASQAATMLAHRGSYGAALALLDITIANDRGNWWLYHQRAMIAITCRDPEVAQERKTDEAAMWDFHRACELTDWKQIGPLAGLRSAYRKLGLFPQALQVEKRLKKLLPKQTPPDEAGGGVLRPEPLPPTAPVTDKLPPNPETTPNIRPGGTTDRIDRG